MSLDLTVRYHSELEMLKDLLEHKESRLYADFD